MLAKYCLRFHSIVCFVLMLTGNSESRTWRWGIYLQTCVLKSRLMSWRLCSACARPVHIRSGNSNLFLGSESLCCIRSFSCDIKIILCFYFNRILITNNDRANVYLYDLFPVLLILSVIIIVKYSNFCSSFLYSSWTNKSNLIPHSGGTLFCNYDRYVL